MQCAQHNRGRNEQPGVALRQIIVERSHGRELYPHPLCWARIGLFPPSAYIRRQMKQHTHSRSERDAQKLRVRRIVGQMNAIERMLEADRDCAEILMQLVSARKAIKSLSENLIHSHMRHCIEHAHSPAEGRKHLQELLVVLERYVE